jgi:pimeloyl-ACP methyl ester carboxylesterase
VGDVAALVTHTYTGDGEGRIHWVGAGDGPLVVLLHGFPEFWYAWRNQIPALLEAGFRVAAPDLRGCGGSGKPRDITAYRVEALADDVRRVVVACGERRAIIVGHDWGGAVAWALAMSAPGLVERLVVCNAPHPATFLSAARDPSQLARISYMLAFQVPVLPEALLKAGRFALLRGALRSLATRPEAFTDVDLDRYVEAWSRPAAVYGALGPYRAMGQALRAGAGGAGRASTVSVPTMVVWGQQDHVLGRGLADPGRHRVPDLRIERIPAAGHFVQADAPAEVNRVLIDFMGQR